MSAAALATWDAAAKQLQLTLELAPGVDLGVTLDEVQSRHLLELLQQAFGPTP